MLVYGACEYDEVAPFFKDMKNNGVTYENPNGALWFACRDAGRVVACVCLVLSKTTGRIKSVYTLPEYRGRGIFSALMKMAEGVAKDSGVKKITGFFNSNSVFYVRKHGYICKEPNRNGVVFAELYV